MTKYARIVIEKEINDDASKGDILNTMEVALQCFMTSIWGTKDIEVHDTPYNGG